MQTTIAIIPARGNSKRLPHKNIKPLGGKPLLEYSINYAKKHNFIDATYVSTDSKEIKEIALGYGVFVIDRPKALSGDLEPTVTTLKHVLDDIDKKVVNIILLQPTNPLRPKDLLKNAFNEFKENDYDSLMTVSLNDKKLGKINKGRFEPYTYKIGQRSQDLEPLYYENGLVYITKSNLILNDKIIGNNNMPYIVNHPYASVDIDTAEDLKYAQFILENYPNE